MFKFIERLRLESESRRRSLTLISAFSFTGIIVVVWLMSLSAGSFYAYEKPKKQVATSSPLAAVWSSITESFSGLAGALSSLKDSKIIFTATSTLGGGE